MSIVAVSVDTTAWPCTDQVQIITVPWGIGVCRGGKLSCRCAVVEGYMDMLKMSGVSGAPCRIPAVGVKEGTMWLEILLRMVWCCRNLHRILMKSSGMLR